MFRSGYAEELMTQVRAKNPGEPEFHQAVREVVESLGPVVERHPAYARTGSWSAWSSPSA